MKKSLLTYAISLLMVVLSGFATINIQAQPIAEVGGTIAADRFFTNDSLYIVTENLRVINGALLKIEAGTTLRFNMGKGLSVEDGKLEAIGFVDQETDSIRFVPNYTDPSQTWKWRGIQVINASSYNYFMLSYVVVSDAEVGIEIKSSSDVHVENSYFVNNFWRAIDIQNSTNVNLINNHLYNNYVGVMITANGVMGFASGNRIEANVLRNEATNILIMNVSGGKAFQNTITENVVQQGVNGIWIDDSGESGSRANTITKNAIINNGNSFGYGLYLAMDSTLVSQNVFWQNSSAIWFPRSSNNIISRNSFYQNGNPLSIKAGSKRNNISNNTFSLNRETALVITEPVGNVLSKNNFMHSITDTLVELQTAQNINATANYWGTVSAAEIDELIYDNNDNPELGELFYIPFLEEPDTLAPLAPPFEVKKQLVNNRLRLSWHANEEADLHSYSIYYRNFKNYEFTERLTGVQDTILFSNELSIDDTIAVTATDRHSLGKQDRFLGYESPYAFARAVPYAGSDTAICQNEEVFVIRYANAPFTYLRSIWNSSGDGYFIEPGSLLTSYLPGEMDYIKGEVRLSLRVVTADEVFEESFKLKFSRDPFAFAGNDTIIGSDSSLRLNTASAEYFDRIRWLSTGDGVFSTSEMPRAVYTPGDQDKLNGEVFLILEAASECGIATDTLRLLIRDEFSLSGKVWDQDQASQNTVVLAFRSADNGYSIIAREHTASDGSFHFEKLFKGQYVLMALPDTIISQTASAYYAEAVTWEAAHNFKLIQPTYDVDIRLAERLQAFPAGTGSITGYFKWPENGFEHSSIFCDDWFGRDQSLQYCDEGLSNVSITLYNSDLKVLLSYTLTDYSGYFIFDSLPFGQYSLHAEIPGYPLNVSPIITLSGGQPEAEVELRIENQKISIYTENQQLPFVEKTLAYPNPVSDYLFLQHTNLKEITIFDHFGHLLEVKTFEANTATTSHTLDMQAYKAGFYLLILRSDKQLQTLKIIKY